MTDRTDGYVTDVSYTADYCRELNPLRMKLALLHAGVRAPEISTACELGFGHGVSLNIHAAASSTQWYGTDINAAHAGFARELGPFPAPASAFSTRLSTISPAARTCRISTTSACTVSGAGYRTATAR